jgi:DNA replication protein DnaC
MSELRLPPIKLMWPALAARADKEGWPAARFLAALAEHEVAARGQRRIERHLASARLPAGKTFDPFDFNAVPMVSRAHVMALLGTPRQSSARSTSVAFRSEADMDPRRIPG